MVLPVTVVDTLEYGQEPKHTNSEVGRLGRFRTPGKVSCLSHWHTNSKSFQYCVIVLKLTLKMTAITFRSWFVTICSFNSKYCEFIYHTMQ